MSFEDRIEALIKADKGRISRMHTRAGQLVLSTDVAAALYTTLGRRVLGRHPQLPWLTYPAIRYVDKLLQGRTLFEFGSGSSTGWFAARCESVYSVENDPSWYKRIAATIGNINNAKLSLIEDNIKFTHAIGEVGIQFSAIVVDAQPRVEQANFPSSDEFRVECLRNAIGVTQRDCVFIIDNTDVNKKLSLYINDIFDKDQIIRMPGWVPGILHPNETTVVIGAPRRGGW